MSTGINKLIVQLLGVAAALITAVQMPGSEWGLPLGTAISGVAAALAVYLTENTVNVPLGKFYGSLLMAGGVALSALLAESDVRTTLTTLVAAVLSSLVVLLVPNQTRPPVTPLVADPVIPAQ